MVFSLCIRKQDTKPVFVSFFTNQELEILFPLVQKIYGDVIPKCTETTEEWIFPASDEVKIEAIQDAIQKAVKATWDKHQ